MSIYRDNEFPAEHESEHPNGCYMAVRVSGDTFDYLEHRFGEGRFDVCESIIAAWIRKEREEGR